jgi:uncharacterized protein (TIGR03083 family)
MRPTRAAFLEAFAAAGSVLALPRLGDSWDGPSALEDFSVKGLAGHLVRAAARVLAYLDEPAGEGEPIEAPAYYVLVMAGATPADELRVRTDGEKDAGPDGESLVARHAQLASVLRSRLEAEPEDRRVKVFGGHVMYLDDYLETRIVELLVHTDDLAVSLGATPPPLPQAAADIALAHLLAVARLGHGDREVLMAFTRRERDPGEALRVF